MKEMKDKLLELQESLLERLEKIKEHKVRIADEARSEDDIAQMEQNEGLIDSLNEREQIMLKQINSALGRIEDGTYGLCLKCEECIAYNRLKALPYALYCKDCMEDN